jgi:phenylalanyl-tRNA synthetase alpha chain
MDKALIEGLSHNEKRLLLALDESGGKGSPQDMISDGKFDVEVEILRAALALESKGLVKIDAVSTRSYEVSDRKAAAILPERKAIAIIAERGGKMPLDDLADSMPGGEDKIAVGWLKRKALADISSEGSSKVIVLNDAGKKASKEKMPDEVLLGRMAESPILESEADSKIIKDLKGRQGLIREVVASKRTVALTPQGTEAARSGLDMRKQVTDMTDRLIQSGEWREVEFRKYDVNIPASPSVPAKKHPLSRLGAEVRRMFAEMGFREMSSEYVQSAFWNLDVLFTPQDHPARDLQDTFYLEEPASIRIEDDALVDAVRNIHENGGGTGSSGWGGSWSREKAEAALLRTHSTVSSIRYVAEHPEAPQKAFSISRIFRNESIDSTHLPEFTQIEGIVIDENGSFDMLISIIRDFYARMGFDRIRIRPAYFPYTEPSLELEVFFNGKWMELGGAGIFRPEVVAPFGVKHPVLAWGFGFERLAMLKWNIKDIRDLYISDLDVLKGNTVL